MIRLFAKYTLTGSRAVAAVCAVLLWLVPVAGQAVPVADLYQVEVTVADQGNAERNRAFKEGLKQVLVKVTGRSDAASHPQVAKALSQAGSYMVAFGYQSLPATESTPEQLSMSIVYSEPVVSRLVRRSGLPIWPADRPEVLFWLVTDLPGEGRRHVGRDLMPEAHAALESAFAKRGEPLLVPLLDLEDQLTLSASNAWAFNNDQLTAAAKRYNAAHWAVLRFYQTNAGEYRGAVQVQAGQHSGLDSVEAESLEALVNKAVDMTVDRVAAGYAFVPVVRSEEVTLVLENVRNHKVYKAALKSIGNFEIVRAVRVASINGDQLDLRLTLDGDVERLLKRLRRNKRLVEVADLTSEQTVLRFRWSP